VHVSFFRHWGFKLALLNLLICLMKGVVRVGDRTIGGEAVLAGSSSMRSGGIYVAREGDPVSCPVPSHGRTVIAEGHSAFRDNGVPVAFDGHRCACVCVLISSMPSAGAR